MEVERKFLLTELPGALPGARRSEILQGYLVLGDGGAEARLRRRAERYWLTVKAGAGRTRTEVETELGAAQFAALWPATEGRRLEKTRHELALDGGLTAEVDVYAGALAGLLVVEVEFASEADADGFTPPAWFGVEVTDDAGYKNRSLATVGRPGE